MSSKTHLNLSIDVDILDIIKAKYPYRLSQLVEDFLKNIANTTIEPDKNTPSDVVIKEIEDLTIKINQLKAELPRIKEKELGGEILTQEVVE